MNLDLKISKEYRKKLKYKQQLRTGLLSDDGIKYRFEFDNYGVSVIKSEFTYGGEYDLWGVAIMEIGKNNIVYDKELSGHDVLGFLTDEDVNKFLYCVKNGMFDKPFEEIKDTINMNCNEDCPYVMPCGDCFACSEYPKCNDCPSGEVCDKCKNCFNVEK